MATHNPALAELNRRRGRPESPPARAAQGPCAWARELTGREREANGKSHARRWNWCDHPQDGRGKMNGRIGLPLAEKIVCTCKGCGPKCAGYESEDEPSVPTTRASVTKAFTPNPAGGLVGWTAPGYPGGHAGRGIVTSAGGAKYFTCVWIMLSVLRRHGCTLPVEVWHLGPEELDPAMRAALESLPGVRVVDAHAVRDSLPEAERPKRLAGWESKAFAIRHSAFAEVLFLDADQIPAGDPTYLFDAPEFREHGAVFWPDYPPEGWCLTDAGFRAAGIVPPGRTTRPGWRNPTDYTPFETGQILLDKARQWGPLSLWQHLGDHCGFWYSWNADGRGKNLGYGDKDTAWVAWHHLAAPYAMPPACGWTGSKKTSGAFLQRDFAGRVIFQHRVQPVGKWSLHGNNPRTEIAGWDWCTDALAELRTRWSGDVWGPGRSDRTRAAGAWVLFAGTDPPRPIVLGADGRVKSDWCTRWSMTDTPDGPRLALATADRARVVLGPDEHGNWVNHGQETFLMPAVPADFHLPPGRHELAVYHSIHVLNEYRLPERLLEGSVVLDVGAHVGASVRAFLERGAAHVVAVEPHPANLEYLYANYGADPRVTILPVAVWDRMAIVRLGIPPGAEASTGWSALAAAGLVQVLAQPLDALVEIAAARSPAGRVAMLKLDCEGAEWEALSAARRLDLVDDVRGEYHLGGRNLLYTAERFGALLERAGFTVELVPHPRAWGLGNFFAARTNRG